MRSNKISNRQKVCRATFDSLPTQADYQKALQVEHQTLRQQQEQGLQRPVQVRPRILQLPALRRHLEPVVGQEESKQQKTHRQEIINRDDNLNKKNQNAPPVLVQMQEQGLRMQEQESQNLMVPY